MKESNVEALTEQIKKEKNLIPALPAKDNRFLYNFDNPAVLYKS